jgi:hypothetical protein
VVATDGSPVFLVLSPHRTADWTVVVPFAPPVETGDSNSYFLVSSLRSGGSYRRFSRLLGAFSPPHGRLDCRSPVCTTRRDRRTSASTLGSCARRSAFHHDYDPLPDISVLPAAIAARISTSFSMSVANVGLTWSDTSLSFAALAAATLKPCGCCRETLT